MVPGRESRYQPRVEGWDGCIKFFAMESTVNNDSYSQAFCFSRGERGERGGGGNILLCRRSYSKRHNKTAFRPSPTARSHSTLSLNIGSAT